jgi:hypothetical protein
MVELKQLSAEATPAAFEKALRCHHKETIDRRSILAIGWKGAEEAANSRRFS